MKSLITFFLLLGVIASLTAQGDVLYKTRQIIRNYEASLNVTADVSLSGNARNNSLRKLQECFVSSESGQFDFIQYYLDEIEGTQSSGYFKKIGNFGALLATRKYERTEININKDDLLIIENESGELYNALEVRFIQEVDVFISGEQIGQEVMFSMQAKLRPKVIGGNLEGYLIESMSLLQPDNDNDKFIDKEQEDQCIGQFGTVNGCPDQDGDGVADKDDLCPTIAGDQPTGCLDNDGDGVQNSIDKCPNIKGRRLSPSSSNFGTCNGCPDQDGDGVCGILDRCPEVRGSKALRGCPDVDNDQIPDIDDACPYEPGRLNRGNKSCNGCPDQDGDKLCDKEDKCPAIAGSPSSGGCPDMDGDGVIDEEDNCPNVAGKKLSSSDRFFYRCNGCPDSDKDGICDSEDECETIPYRRGNGCPPDRPPGNFSVCISGSYGLPIGDFSSNQLFDRSTIGFNEGVGLAQGGFGGALSIAYLPNTWLGVQLRGGIQRLPLNLDAFSSNIQLFLLGNNVTVSSIELGSNSPYQFLFGTIDAKIGAFKTGRKFTFAFTPGVGLLSYNTIGNTDRLTGIVSYSNGSSSFSNIDLNFTNSESTPSLLTHFGVELSRQIFFNDLYICSSVHWYGTKLTYNNQSSVIAGIISQPLVLSTQKVNWYEFSFGINYYLGKKNRSILSPAHF